MGYLAENIRATWRLWKESRTILTVALSVVGAVLALVGYSVGTATAGKTAVLLLGVIAAFLLFYWTPSRMWERSQEELEEFRRAFRPKALLVFDSREVKHVQPGTVIREVSGTKTPYDEYLYAIGVVNLSPTPVPGCRLVLEASDPHDTSQQRLERAMMVRNEPQQQSDGVFTLNPRDGRQPSVYVEVLREIVPRQGGPGEQASIQLRYANSLQGHPNWFTGDDYILTFRLEGHMAQAVTYQLTAKYDRKLRRWNVASGSVTQPPRTAGS